MTTMLEERRCREDWAQIARARGIISERVVAETFGPDLRMRAVRARTRVRKLPERLHQPHTA